MSGLDELAPPELRTVEDGLVDPTGWRARILDDAAGPNDRVRVRVPGLDNGQHAHGPCPFMPRGEAIPSKGDHAIVEFDDEYEPYIALWWPA
jgi:hypothetical protein